MILLRDILYKVPIRKVLGDTAIAIGTIHFNSAKVELNDVFVAVRGTRTDGHSYIKQATDKGALAIICEDLPDSIINGITYVQVENSSETLAVIAANYYENPSEKLKLVGITGTNGKTTVSTLLYELFRKKGIKSGLISTIKIRVGEKEFPNPLTTPDSLTINRHLKAMVDAGVEYCFMEVSSHGIHQHRTAGLTFAGGIFTNLSHDHLDYHESFSAYRDVKKIFFDTLSKDAFALSNTDDKNGLVMLQNTKAKKYSYALKTDADFKAVILESQFDGQLLKIENQEVWVRLIGNFNAYNLLAVYAGASLLGLPSMEILQVLSSLESVGGRFQYFISSGKTTVIVDYAHTPDALRNVLETINQIREKNQKVITVVGCGGDRDSQKRPVMGNIAAAMSSKAIFTSDNPRSEDPEKIISQMKTGVLPEHEAKFIAITNRKEAIKTACLMADSETIILIAGKGHETYQEIQGERFEFDDFKIVQEILTQLKK